MRILLMLFADRSVGVGPASDELDYLRYGADLLTAFAQGEIESLEWLASANEVGFGEGLSSAYCGAKSGLILVGFSVLESTRVSRIRELSNTICRRYGCLAEVRMIDEDEISKLSTLN